jgi:hypothetical protein
MTFKKPTTLPIPFFLPSVSNKPERLTVQFTSGSGFFRISDGKEEICLSVASLIPVYDTFVLCIAADGKGRCVTERR